MGHLTGVGGGNVIFNDRKVDRRALDATHAVALTLIFMIADQAAHRRQGIVLEQHPARIIQTVGLQQTNHFRDVGVDGAALLATGIFAAQAMIGFVHNVQCHVFSSFPARAQGFCTIFLQQSCKPALL